MASAPEGTKKKRILLLTNSDLGQASVFLATIHALLLHPNSRHVDLHASSFAKLGPSIQKYASLASSSSSVTFHPLTGTSHFERAFLPSTNAQPVLDLPLPSLLNTASFIRKIPYLLMPWSPTEYADIFAQTRAVFDAVQPDLVVVDPVFSAGLTLCWHLSSGGGGGGRGSKLKWTVLSPNTIKEFALAVQPRMQMFWKYPLMSSALPYPIPLHLIPHNILLTLILIYTILTSPRYSRAAARIRQLDPSITRMVSAGDLGSFAPPAPGLRILLGCAPELDYPFEVVPGHLVSCGPILRPAGRSLEDGGGELGRWLGSGGVRGTVYVNLGTHLSVSVGEAVEMARGLKGFLDRAGQLGGREGEFQVLWKLKRKDAAEGDGDELTGAWKEVEDVLRAEIDADRVRIVSWLDAEPLSVLLSGRVACMVNHGGANSFWEALCAGVPQVVLPAWMDCYDFGNRAELLKIGVWANKTAMPRWEQSELCEGLTRVVLGVEAEGFRRRAEALAAKYPEHGGREKAAELIMQMLDEDE